MKGASKMRHAFLCLLSLAVLPGAAEARTGWQGRAVITALAGAACAADGFAVGQRYISTFLPSGITDNGPNSFMTFLTELTSFSVRTAGRPAINKPYEGVRIGSYGNFPADPLQGRIVSFVSDPAITPTAPFLNVTVRVSNFDSTVGCTATLDIGYVLRR
jgi:hypothetical protein